MDFQESALTIEVRELARSFSNRVLTPSIEDDEAHERFRPEWIREMGSLGLTGIMTPEAWGGAGLGLAEQAAALEEIAAWNAAYAISVSVSTLPQSILNQSGSDAQKRQFLGPLARGEMIGAFSLSEAFAGSDASGLRTTARPEGDHYILNGSKMWCTQADVAGVIILMAKAPQGITAFAIPAGSPGVRMGKREKKIAMNTSHTMEVILEDAKVPSSARIGAEGAGLKIALSALESGRVSIGACALGVMRRSIEVATAYSKEREQFGDKISEFQGISFLLADLWTEYEACRLLIGRASWLRDQGLPYRKESAMAKLRASDGAMRAATEAVQILGGAGVTREFPVERLMREAKILQIVEGTSQIQRVVIAREVLR